MPIDHRRARPPRYRRRLAVVAVATVLATIAAGCADDAATIADPTVSPAVDAAPVDSPDWTLAWSDEFDGTGVDEAAWSIYHNTYGDGNDELACLTPDNVSVADGVLRIEARAEVVTCPSGDTRGHTSGFLGSREVGRLHPLYGRYEIRARVPHGQGLWPAFWLRHAEGAGWAEVDVLEVFHSQRPGEVAQTLHFPEHLGSNAWSRSTFLESPVRGTGGWHTYAVEITEDPVSGGVRFVFSIDGEVTGEFIDEAAAWRDGTDPLRTWDLAVNLAVGGRWVGDPGSDLGYLPLVDRCSLDLERPLNGPASCPSDGLHLASLPAIYEVDHVRVSLPTRPDPG